jgi:hypothetical protein
MVGPRGSRDCLGVSFCRLELFYSVALYHRSDKSHIPMNVYALFFTYRLLPTLLISLLLL